MTRVTNATNMHIADMVNAIAEKAIGEMERFADVRKCLQKSSVCVCENVLCGLLLADILDKRYRAYLTSCKRIVFKSKADRTSLLACFRVHGTG